MKLINLIKNGIDSDKLDELEVIEMLIDKTDEDSSKKLYKCIYEKAYGKTISKELAEEIVNKMAVTDGSERENGEKWSYDQTSAVGSQVGMDWTKVSKVSFYVVMNMLYSDNINTAKRYDLADDAVYFASSAKDWLCDVDIPDGNKKLFNYVFDVAM